MLHIFNWLLRAVFNFHLVNYINEIYKCFYMLLGQKRFPIEILPKQRTSLIYRNVCTNVWSYRYIKKKRIHHEHLFTAKCMSSLSFSRCVKKLVSSHTKYLLYQLIFCLFGYLIISNIKCRIILFGDFHWKLIMASWTLVINKLTYMPTLYIYKYWEFTAV